MAAAQLVQVVKVALSVFAICAVWVWVFWTQFQPLFAEEPAGEGDPLEACHWLRTCPEDGGLSPERFRRPGEALDFVRRLYQLGAVAVRVAAVREGGRAGGLVIELPDAGAARERIFAAVAAEAAAGGLPPEQDAGQSYLRLWWDE